MVSLRTLTVSASLTLQRVIVIAAAVCVVQLGCAELTVRPGDTSYQEFVIPCPRPQVFDDALEFAQDVNLSVAVLEKSSGLINFEYSHLKPFLLDLFTEFPLLDSRTGKAASTFAQWSNVEDATVRLNVLMSESGPTSTGVNVRGNWQVVLYNPDLEVSTNYTLNSTGILEGMLRQHVLRRCERSTTPDAMGLIRWFESSYRDLKTLYDHGKLDSDEYARRRDQLFEDFQRNSAGGS